MMQLKRKKTHFKNPNVLKNKINGLPSVLAAVMASSLLLTACGNKHDDEHGESGHDVTADHKVDEAAALARENAPEPVDMGFEPVGATITATSDTVTSDTATSETVTTVTNADTDMTTTADTTIAENVTTGDTAAAADAAADAVEEVNSEVQ